jgi:peptidoglycan/xylan/chitin deacetylase (PgdA/CDA1 family)
LTAPQVTRYKGGKEAAASYTFDDGYASSDKIASIFENRGFRATFYIVPTTVEGTTGWDFWKALHNKGHEVGNHSMTHTIDMSDPTLSDQALNTEINGAQQLIEQKLGVRPLTFAFPWHQYTSKAFSIANQNHFSVRQKEIGESNYAFAFFDQDHAATLADALAIANNQLTDMVNSGGWLVAGGHGVDGDGWSPVTSQFLQDHLSHASQYASRLWIDTYANVARYRLCRPQGAPTATASSSSRATVRLAGSFNASVCNAPLTVSLPVKEPLYGQVQVRNSAGNTVASTISGGKLLFDVRPGETVTVDVTQ